MGTKRHCLPFMAIGVFLIAAGAGWGGTWPDDSGRLLENQGGTNIVITNGNLHTPPSTPIINTSGTLSDHDRGGTALIVRPDTTVTGSISATDLTVNGYVTNITNNSTVDSNAFGPLVIFGSPFAHTSSGLNGNTQVTNLTGDQKFTRMNLTNNTTNFTIQQSAATGTSSAFGGAARLANLPNLVYDTGTISGNKLTLNIDTTTATNASDVHANGGAVAIENDFGTTATLNNLAFSNNAVAITSSAGMASAGANSNARGGALYAANYNNEPGTGPGVPNTGMDLRISNTSFLGNSVRNAGDGGAHGGAVFANIAVRPEFDKTTFTGNSASANSGNSFGGAVAMVLSDNLAGGTSAGTLDALGTENGVDYYASFTDSTFTNNSASSTTGTAAGGAIWSNKTFLVSGTTFTGNTATGNTATGNANAIHLADNTTHVIFKDNGAAKSTDNDGISGDGNIYKRGSGSLELFGNYDNFNGTYALEQGVTKFKQATGNNNAILQVSTGATVSFEEANGSLTVADAQLAAGSTFIAGILDATTAAGITSTNATVDSDAIIKISGKITGTGTYTLLYSDNPITYTGGGYNQQVNTSLIDYVIRGETKKVVLAIDTFRAINSVALTPNQNALATYLQSHPDHGIYQFAYGDETPEAIRLALDTNTGDIYATAGVSIVMGDRRTASSIIDRAQQALFQDAPVAEESIVSPTSYGSMLVANPNPTRIWAEGDGFRFNSDDLANAGKGKTSGYGVTLGADKLLNDWLFGAAFRYEYSDLDVKNRFAKADIDSYSAALYAARRLCVGPGVVHITGGVNGGYHEIEGQRTSIVGANHNHYEADYYATSLAAYLDAGMTFGDTSGFAFQPFVTGMWNGYWNDKFKEKGFADYALTGYSGNNDNFSTILGVRVMARVHDRVAFDASAGWRRTYGDLEHSNSMRFTADAGGDRFAILGIPLERNEAVLNAGVTVNLTEAISMRAAYEFTGNSSGKQHTGRLNFGIDF